MASNDPSYMRHYRAKNPDKVWQSKRTALARSRALADLALLYPDDYQRLLTIRRKELNLPPQG